MAPEQFRDVSGVDHRADIFALGAILYELVTGVRAYDGGNLLAIYQKSAQGQYKPPRELVPDVPPSVALAIEKCLKVDTKLRPASCEELLQIVYGDGSVDAIMAAKDVPPEVPVPAPAPAPPPAPVPAPAPPVAPVAARAPEPPRPGAPPPPARNVSHDAEIEAFERPKSRMPLIVGGLFVLLLIAIPAVGLLVAGVGYLAFN
jgi:serine/threonine-protein kinase